MVAGCSVCGSSSMSPTQKRKPVSVRRCYQCVLSERFEADESNDPEGIHVEILADAAPVQQTQTRFGRSVHLDRGSEYSIEISNERPGLHRFAVVVRVDGEKVSPTPILIGKQRVIDGFTLQRDLTEMSNENRNGYRYLIQKTVARFRVSSQDASSSRGETANNKIGTIECEFYRLKMVTVQPGKRTRKLRKARNQQSHGRARSGLLATAHGEKDTESGEHFSSGNKKPMADYSRPLGTCRLFICDRNVVSLGDFLQ